MFKASERSSTNMLVFISNKTASVLILKSSQKDVYRLETQVAQKLLVFLHYDSKLVPIKELHSSWAL